MLHRLTLCFHDDFVKIPIGLLAVGCPVARRQHPAHALLQRLVRGFNDVVRLLLTSVLVEEEVSDRSTSFAVLVRMAGHAARIRNYQLLAALKAAFSSPAMLRLRRTRKLFEKTHSFEAVGLRHLIDGGGGGGSIQRDSVDSGGGSKRSHRRDNSLTGLGKSFKASWTSATTAASGRDAVRRVASPLSGRSGEPGSADAESALAELSRCTIRELQTQAASAGHQVLPHLAVLMRDVERVALTFGRIPSHPHDGSLNWEWVSAIDSVLGPFDRAHEAPFSALFVRNESAQRNLRSALSFASVLSDAVGQRIDTILIARANLLESSSSSSSSSSSKKSGGSGSASSFKDRVSGGASGDGDASSSFSSVVELPASAIRNLQSRFLSFRS